MILLSEPDDTRGMTFAKAGEGDNFSGRMASRFNALLDTLRLLRRRAGEILARCRSTRASTGPI